MFVFIQTLFLQLVLELLIVKSLQQHLVDDKGTAPDTHQPRGCLLVRSCLSNISSVAKEHSC